MQVTQTPSPTHILRTTNVCLALLLPAHNLPTSNFEATRAYAEQSLGGAITFASKEFNLSPALPGSVLRVDP
jgi:hypothetical protein